MNMVGHEHHRHLLPTVQSGQHIQTGIPAFDVCKDRLSPANAEGQEVNRGLIGRQPVGNTRGSGHKTNHPANFEAHALRSMNRSTEPSRRDGLHRSPFVGRLCQPPRGDINCFEGAGGDQTASRSSALHRPIPALKGMQGDVLIHLCQPASPG